jgi:aryl-alcohol dehydrogenase-like predicted oxidoreductase
MTGPGTTFSIGGDITVHRLGFGAMQITGDGVWGPPRDRTNAVAVLRKAVELGVDFIDTADSYGPTISEELIAEALYPYEGTVVATKAGFARTGPGRWHAIGLPAYLKQQCELSLRRLRLDCIPLFQLHRVDQRVPLADQVGALADLRSEGKIKHIGLSEVTVSQLDEAAKITPISTVQNLYNVGERTSEPLLQVCEQRGIGFIPWYPVGSGQLAVADSPLGRLAARVGHTPAELALAWLLWKSPVMLPIPGTKSVSHLAENCAASSISLPDDVLAEIEAITPAGTDPEETGQRVRGRRR